MTQAVPTFAVNRHVPMVHVASVDDSIAFYALLGFSPVNTLKDPRGHCFWARCSSGPAEIMFARADGPVDPTQQAVLFYMYSPDVAALRAHLLQQGLHDGATFRGQPGPNDGRRVVFAITRPDYMPAGEVRVSDPDGYCILIGQLG
jgi:hypothetical protein